MAQTTKYHIYYPDVDQAGYEEKADMPAYMKDMADSVEAALDGLDLSDTYQTLANLVTEITSSSTDDKYASAKAVYTFVNGIVGNLESILETLDIGSGV